MNLGERIKLCRQDRKMSREELANKLGLSKFAITKYEQGQRTPNTEILLNICNALDVDISYIIKSRIIDNNRLTMLLNSKNLTVSELLNLLNLDKSFFDKLSNDSEIISDTEVAALYKISDFFNVNPYYLLGESDFKFYEDDAISNFEILVEEIKLTKHEDTRILFRDITDIFFYTLRDSISFNKIHELELIKNFYNSFLSFRNSLNGDATLRSKGFINQALTPDEFNSLISDFKTNISHQIDTLAEYYRNLDNLKDDYDFELSKIKALLNTPSEE